ncbi:NUDIX domain-containing protein [Bosea sp. (in: a-proteobacteria)]
MRHIVNAIFVRPDSVLLARRSIHRKSYPDLWSFPGGHVEAGESFDEALVREVREELAVAPVRFEPFMEISDPHVAVGMVTYHMYLVSEWHGTPKIVDTEHSELRWFSVGEACLLSNLALEEYVYLFEKLRELNG